MTYQGEDRRKNRDDGAYFNAQIGLEPLDLQPGGLVFSDSDKDMIVAMLGSGLMVTLFDPVAKCGAAIYVLLPPEIIEAFPSLDSALEKKRQDIFSVFDRAIARLREAGHPENELFVRMCGASEMPDGLHDYGLKARVLLKEYFIRKGLQIRNEDCGGRAVRRAYFIPSTGRLMRIMLRREEDIAKVRALEKNSI